MKILKFFFFILLSFSLAFSMIETRKPKSELSGPGDQKMLCQKSQSAEPEQEKATWRERLSASIHSSLYNMKKDFLFQFGAVSTVASFAYLFKKKMLQLDNFKNRKWLSENKKTLLPFAFLSLALSRLNKRTTGSELKDYVVNKVRSNIDKGLDNWCLAIHKKAEIDDMNDLIEDLTKNKYHDYNKNKIEIIENYIKFTYFNEYLAYHQLTEKIKQLASQYIIIDQNTVAQYKKAITILKEKIKNDALFSTILKSKEAPNKIGNIICSKPTAGVIIEEENNKTRMNDIYQFGEIIYDIINIEKGPDL